MCGRSRRRAELRGIRSGALYALPVPKFLCQVWFPADVSKPQCPVFQWKAPVLSEPKYLLKHEKILCVPKQEPGVGIGEGQEKKGDTGEWRGAGSRDAALGKWDGVVGRDAVGSGLGRVRCRGEGEGLVAEPEQWNQGQSQAWEVQPQMGTRTLSPGPWGTALGWFPWHFPAAALPAPKAVIKCTQTHNYRGAVAGGHASSAGVLGALPLCTCLCSNAKGDVSCCCDACAACTASRQGTDQSPRVPRQGRDHVPHAPGRAGISAPMSPGRTAISISPWPQAGQGSVSPGTPRPCRDLQQGREETGVSVPSGNPPYTIPTALSPPPPRHVPHLTVHVSHPCGVTLCHDTQVGCRFLKGGARQGGCLRNWSRVNGVTLNVSRNNDFKNVSFCKLIKARARIPSSRGSEL